MLDSQIGGGYGHKDHRSSGYEFVDHKEFVSHAAPVGGYYDHQGSYNHHMRAPANYGRPTMSHMPVCDEEVDSDVEEYFESSHHSVSNNRHHQQPPPLNFMPPPPMAMPHHTGKMSNGWQGGHGMQHHGGHGMQHHGGHGMVPQVPSRHGYMNPYHGGGGAVVVKAQENWRVSSNGGGHQKVGWGSKGL